MKLVWATPTGTQQLRVSPQHPGFRFPEAKLAEEGGHQTLSPHSGQGWESKIWTRPPRSRQSQTEGKSAREEQVTKHTDYYRLLVNICQAVGRLDISVLKHSNLISLSKLYLHDKSLFTMRSFLWLQLQYKCAPSSRDTRGCVHHLTLLQLFKVDTGSVTCRYANHVYTLSCKCLKCSIYAWYKQTPIAEAVTPLPGLFTSYLIEAMGSQTASQP